MKERDLVIIPWWWKITMATLAGFSQWASTLLCLYQPCLCVSTNYSPLSWFIYYTGWLQKLKIAYFYYATSNLLLFILRKENRILFTTTFHAFDLFQLFIHRSSPIIRVLTHHFNSSILIWWQNISTRRCIIKIWET